MMRNNTYCHSIISLNSINWYCLGRLTDYAFTYHFVIRTLSNSTVSKKNIEFNGYISRFQKRIRISIQIDKGCVIVERLIYDSQLLQNYMKWNYSKKNQKIRFYSTIDKMMFKPIRTFEFFAKYFITHNFYDTTKDYSLPIQISINV